MNYIYPFPSQLPASSHDLPATLISLETWQYIQVIGTDTYQYLQGQLTKDLLALKPGEQTLAAHCNAKGRVWSNLHLFPIEGGLGYLTRKSVCPQQLTEFKKYAVFSKVTFTQSDEIVLLGFAGYCCRTHLSTIFSKLPDQQQQVVTEGSTILIWQPIPTERFIIITTPGRAQELFEQLLGKVALNNSQQWLALDIEAGLPIIDSSASQQFLPQAFNLQALDAISFHKGCYVGQEMVARAKYRGTNKRALYWLSGHSYLQPQCGDELELQLGENWRKTGMVLAAVKLHDETLWVQVILNSDLTQQDVLRVSGDPNSQLTIQPLSYSLEK